MHELPREVNPSEFQAFYIFNPAVSPFGVIAPGIFAVMTPPETSNSRVRTGIKVA
jgi:hypothetical protein